MWMLGAVLLVAVAAPAGSEQVKFGQEWIDADGDAVKAEMDIYWASWISDFAYARSAALDDSRSKLDQGLVPLTKDEIEKGAYATLYLAIDQNGVPTSCSVVKPNKIATVNLHACEQTMKYAKFHPALDLEGNRVAIRDVFSVSYRAVTSPPTLYTVALPPDYEEKKNKREAATAQAVTISTLGLNAVANLATGKSASMTLKLDAAGNPISCELTSPTFVDVVDGILCKNAKAMSYVGALDYKGDPIAARAYLNIKF